MVGIDNSAIRFDLPDNWRAEQTGFAIDKPNAYRIDDVVAATSTEEGHTLHVSIAEGAFLPERFLIASYVYRALVEQGRNPGSLSPTNVAHLSLLHGQERPAVTVHIPVDKQGNTDEPYLTRDIMRAQRLTPKTVNNWLAQGQGAEAVALQSLYSLTKLLYNRRNGNSKNPKKAADFIVHESMTAASAVMADFFDRHGIPGIYNMAASANRPQQRLLHFTSPLRDMEDFVNHCNLAAFMQGKEDYPYPPSRLMAVIEWIREQQSNGARPLSPPGIERSANYFMDRIQTDLIDENDLANALFYNLIGTGEAQHAAHLAAAQFISRKPRYARMAIRIAPQRRLIRLRSPSSDEPIDSGNLIIEDAQGNSYPYPMPVEQMLPDQSVSLRLIDEISEGTLESALPPPMDERKESILRAPALYLAQLAAEECVGMHSQAAGKGGSTQVRVFVRLGDRVHKASASHADKKIAAGRASLQLIHELDLIDNPPMPPAEPDTMSDVVNRLHAVAQQTTGQPAEYHLSDIDEFRDYTCTVKLAKRDILPEPVSARGRSKKIAKRRAAAELLAKLTAAQKT